MWGVIILIAIAIIYAGWLFTEVSKPKSIGVVEDAIPSESIHELAGNTAPVGSVAGLTTRPKLTTPVVNSPTWVFQLGKTGAYTRAHTMRYRDTSRKVRTMWLTIYGVISVDGVVPDYDHLNIKFYDPDDNQNRMASVSGQGKWLIHDLSGKLLFVRNYIHVLNASNVKQKVEIVRGSSTQPTLPAVPAMPPPPPQIVPDPTYEFMLHGFKNARAGSFKFIAPDGSTKVAFLAKGPEFVVTDDKLSKIEYRGRIEIMPPWARNYGTNSNPLPSPYKNMPNKYVVKYVEQVTIFLKPGLKDAGFHVCCSNQPNYNTKLKAVVTDQDRSWRSAVMYYYAPGLPRPGKGVGVSIQKKGQLTVPPKNNIWK